MDSDAVDRAQGRASLTKYSSVHHQYNNKDNTLDNDINNTTSLYNTSYSDDYPYRPRLDQNQNHERAYYYKDLPDEYQSDYHSDGRPYSTPHNSSHHHYTRHLQQHNQNQYQVQSQFESQDRCRLSESAEINHPESRLVAHPLSQQDPIQRQSTPYQQQSQSQWHQQEPNSTLPVSSHSSCPSPHPKQPEPDLDQPLPNTTNRTSIGRLPLLPSNGLPRLPGRMGDRNSTMHDSSYDSNQEDSEDFEEFNPGEHNYQYKFGTDLPNTVDLRSAIESCDALCKFALHYSKQPSSLHRDDLETLSPEMRANLQKIRFMNTTMLIGLQHVHQRPNEGEDAPTNSAQPGQAGRQERETSPVRFDSYGQPAHEIVHELAKAATSIFQLAIRIKAWVSMTPEQRELDEDINMIRGKRCLLMDSTLASATVDRHGNVKKDWTVVPAASSTSKSFYERQRDLDQQRPMLGQTQSQKQSHPQSQMKQGQSPANGYLSNRKMDSDNDDRLVKLGSNGSGIPFSRSHGGHSYQDNISCSPSSDSNISRASFDGNSRSQGYGKGGGSSRGGIADSSLNSRDSKNGDVPYQKYRKRAKRTQPPGRCLSCDSSDTPEWRRGPDGARTLCNACGLHYAKLLKRQNGMGSQQLSSGPPMKKGLPNIARMDQLQAITLPLRRRNESQSLDPSIRLKSESPSLDAGTSNSNQGELDTVVTTPAPDRPDPQTSSSHQQTTSDGAASVTAAIAATSLDNEPKDFVMKQEP
ncbi:hypothetical protein BGX27_007012 [Mortierella sp. AM989]|nr:hypothetical protein BGX27_007012 [Mortierella sp. AM989]